MSIKITFQNELSLRKSLHYHRLFSSTYYYEPALQVVKLDLLFIEKVKDIAFKDPTYGARRIAAMMRRQLNIQVNRKMVAQAVHALKCIESSKKKSDIIGLSIKLVRATRPYELLEADITYV
jgi:hypothetical protein